MITSKRFPQLNFLFLNISMEFVDELQTNNIYSDQFSSIKCTFDPSNVVLLYLCLS